MSATMGTSHPLARRASLMNCRFFASFTVGAVMRTISQPTAARSSVCWTHAAVSMVSHVSIDWTRIGLGPPTPTLPARTSRVTRRSPRGEFTLFGRALLLLLGLEGPVPRKVLHVEEGHKEHEPYDDAGANACHDFYDFGRDGLAPDAFDEREDDVAAVEHGDRQEVQHRQVHIREDAEPERHAPAVLALEYLVVDAHDADGAAEVLGAHVGLRGEERVEHVSHAVEAAQHLLDGVRMDEHDFAGVEDDAQPRAFHPVFARQHDGFHLEGKRPPAARDAEGDGFFRAGDQLVDERLRAVDLPAVDLDDLVFWPQARGFGGRVRVHLADDEARARRDLHLPEA